MKVMVIVKATKDSEAGVLPSERLLAEMGKFNEELIRAGVLLAAEGLRPTGQGVRIRYSSNDPAVVHGPFTETKELVAGFWLWQVGSIEEAIAWAKRVPNPMMEEHEIEVRPVYEPDDFAPVDPTGEIRAAEVRLRAESERTVHERKITLALACQDGLEQSPALAGANDTSGSQRAGWWARSRRLFRIEFSTAYHTSVIPAME